MKVMTILTKSKSIITSLLQLQARLPLHHDFFPMLLHVRNFHHSSFDCIISDRNSIILVIFCFSVYPDNYRAFLRLLKEARRYGQDGKEMEMNSSLKKAEHIMLNTKLNEERNRWHTDFNNISKCARKLCLNYGLKPAAR